MVGRDLGANSHKELRYFLALKRIAAYMPPETIHRKAEKMYGVGGPEAIEMAYENVLNEARIAIRGQRTPKVKP